MKKSDYIINHDTKHYLVFKKVCKKVTDHFPLAICKSEEQAEGFINELSKTKKDL